MQTKHATTTLMEIHGRRRVLNEARAMFLERGFAEVSMQQIADAAGMTKASLYYHFRDKEELFAEVVCDQAEHMIARIRAELEGIESFREQLKRIAMFSFSAKRSDMARMASDIQRHLSEERQRQMRRESGGINKVSILRPYFDRARATGELRDVNVEVAILMFWASIEARIKFAEDKPEQERNEELAETLVDMFLNGVGAKTGT
jgi:TetR/AcrR family transcriptional regulator, mexJK operon transcriptional repressor